MFEKPKLTRKVEQSHTGGFDGLLDSRRAVRRRILHDDGIAVQIAPALPDAA
jgi:hypothetical protein